MAGRLHHCLTGYGEIQWEIIANDPIGNPVQMITTQFSSALSVGAKDIVFNQFGAYIYESDTYYLT